MLNWIKKTFFDKTHEKDMDNASKTLISYSSRQCGKSATWSIIDDLLDKIVKKSPIFPTEADVSFLPECRGCGALIQQQQTCQYCDRKHNYIFLSYNEWNQIIQIEVANGGRIFSSENYSFGKLYLLGRETIRYLEGK